ncbi:MULTISPECIES: hypothetical protein [unclassified Pseudomonas]|jgi:hypothetical protein|uniref:hypothetical protein n=1 Tax=Pseudomonas sp. A-R-26 TaxID=2832404 RepID=UPI001CC15A82|nr:hypothetical protein [Pseudomonas sp. A-R-26]
MKTKAKIAWAYLSEIILSAILTTLTCATYGFAETAKFVSVIASDAAAYIFSILLAGALALIWTIFSKTDSAFYNWLSSRGALNTFLQAFGYVVLVELLAVIFSILSKFIADHNFLIASAFIMFMGAINGLTMIGNIFDLIKLNILFEQKNNKPPHG